MTATELNTLVKQDPCILKMNNGDTFTIDHSEFAIADVRTAAILAKDQNGKKVLTLISLGNISSAKTLETAD